ncbi:hypothetical protein [Streptomyces antibioticus]|uniref:hypothetical protein n=1 Tax=Streptomyces antibioticus TaxID=1890 RepID=UPI003D7110B0
MSQPPYPPQPTHGPAQPPKKTGPGKVLGLGCLGIVGLFVLSAVITGIAGSGDDSGKSGTADAKPTYNVVDKDTSGNVRQVVVEVDSTSGLRAVFDDVADTLTDKAGYWVQINCSTGSTAKVDNRLGNGRKAVGNIGAASTGLKDGQTEFETLDGATCPAATPEASQSVSSGIPPVPTGADRQELLNAIAQAAPDAARYEDKAIDAARNQCSALDSDRADWLASQRFTYKDVTTTEAQGKQINTALKSLRFCDV